MPKATQQDPGSTSIGPGGRFPQLQDRFWWWPSLGKPSSETSPLPKCLEYYLFHLRGLTVTLSGLQGGTEGPSLSHCPFRAKRIIKWCRCWAPDLRKFERGLWQDYEEVQAGASVASGEGPWEGSTVQWPSACILLSISSYFQPLQLF